MSHQLISRNPDLARLEEAGYGLEIRGSHLLVHDVPYVNAQRMIRRGILASTLTPAGEVLRQGDHTAWLAGEMPCDATGAPLTKVVLQTNTIKIEGGLTLNFYLSSKPLVTGVYKDLYDKMTTYVGLLEGHAQAVDPTVTARRRRPIVLNESESVFKFMDSASGRSRITHITDKLRRDRVGIVGLGGTGSYVFDLVAKTPAEEIHPIDGDRFQTHCAFRAPGAASLDDLNREPYKVDYYAELYGRMRRGIKPHAVYITHENISILREMTFVFVCVDKGSVRELIFNSLESWGIPFVDVGMGLSEVNGSLQGIVRITSSTDAMRSHIRDKRLVSFAERDDEDIYDQNIQTADLNAAGAIFAVMRWKKYRGFYVDVDREHQTTLTIDGNMLLNDFKP